MAETLREVVDRLADHLYMRTSMTARDDAEVRKALHEAIRAALAEPNEEMIKAFRAACHEKPAGELTALARHRFNAMAVQRLKELG